MTTTALICIACTVGLLACAGGSETGNPLQPTPIALSAWTSDPGAVSLEPTTGGVTLNNMWVAFGTFDFRSGEACGQIVTDDTGPTVDVVDLTSPNVAIEAQAASRDHCGLVVPLKNATEILSADAPSELSNHSVLISGQRDDGVRFVLQYPEPDELELVGNFAVPGDGPLLLAFDVAGLMQGIDLSAATIETNGTIVIDDARNSGLLLAFEMNLECALELYRDANDSGGVDTGDELLANCVP